MDRDKKLMPWTTPTLRTVRETVRGEITASLGRASFVGNSVLRVMADATAAVCHLTLRYLDWVTLQLLPDTAEHEWLDRHGDIWLVNADGSIGRKSGTFARGSVTATGVNGTVLPMGSRLSGSDNWSYETTEQVVVSDVGVPVAVAALQAGADGNREVGDVLSFDSSVAGVGNEAPVISIGGGVDPETDDELRQRVLRRIQQPPMGGAAYDYEAWALAVPGVTRAWAASEMGIGTVSVRFMMDDLRASNDGFPFVSDIEIVSAYINSKRPVTVKECYVMSPIRYPVNFHIANLNPDTEAVRAAIELNIEQMLFYYAAPGQTIYTAWKYSAVMGAAGVISFDLVSIEDDVMPSLGHMGVLGDIYYSHPTPTSAMKQLTKA
jgi:uncharacterized phage protein gp47/JayE